VRFWIQFEHFLRKSGVKLCFFGESAKVKLIVLGEKAELNCVLSAVYSVFREEADYAFLANTWSEM
jgi:hypothetical protein